MKLNNKGFAISVILYSVVILMMGIMYLLLDIINTRYQMSKELKDEVVEYINSQGANTVSDSYASKKATNKLIKMGEMTYQPFGNYYYTGSNPNNYVKFNKELWRVIGVIEEGGVKYLKIIRKEGLIQKTSDNHRIIDSNIFTYLNGEYYETLDASRNMIVSINWRNSEFSNAITPLNAYHEEIITSNKKGAKIGLINASEFGYAAGNSYLSNTLENYASSINDNWLSLTNTYFTMSFNGTKINVVNNGNLEITDNMSAYIYPCIYLKKDILITSGSGTESDPYILSN